MRDIKPKKINRYSEPIMKSEKEKVRFPSVTLSLDVVPEAKDWEVEEEYTITLKLKMTGISMRKSMNSYDDEWGNNATFDIIGVDVPEEKKEKDDSDD